MLLLQRLWKAKTAIGDFQKQPGSPFLAYLLGYVGAFWGIMTWNTQRCFHGYRDYLHVNAFKETTTNIKINWVLFSHIWIRSAGYQSYTPGDLSLSSLINQSKSSRTWTSCITQQQWQQGQNIHHLVPFRQHWMGLQTGFTSAVKSVCQKIPRRAR